MDEVALLRRKLERERAARKEAERILETKAAELFDANQNLKKLNQNLELEIAKRTASLQESELRYRVLVEQARDIIYNVDDEGYFMYVNSTGIERFGYTEENILGRRYVEFIPEEDVAKEFAYYTMVKERGIKTDYHEFRVKSKSGDLFWLGQNVNRVENEDGSYYFTVVARDITQRKMTEAALEVAKLTLQKSEVKYRSIIENMDLGLMEVDTEGKILRVYDKFNQMLGYENDELIGKSANETLLVAGYEKVLQEQDANRNKGETGVYEVKIKKKNGDEIWVLISGAPFYNEKGEIAGSIGVHYDITDRKNLEEELEVARSKAVKAQQAEKAFLANMSHEIRTPLNAIIGMSHLLMDTPLNDEQQDYLEALTSSADVLKSLISDILDISKIDAGSLDVQNKAFNIHRSIDQLITSFSLQDPTNNVVFESAVDPQIDYMLYSDPQLLNQVLLNLLSNAQKFTRKGSVNLSVELLDEAANNVTLRFSVNDTGIGISKDEVAIIFNEFKQANTDIRNKYGGTGLGLSISNQLVKLLGGTLKVDSKVGEGSSFYFVLTLGKSTHKIDGTTVIKRVEKLRIRDHKILIVEDNKMNLKYITSLLKKWDVDFTVCVNGKEACDLAEKEKFDLIFMDLQMPVMDGFEATQIIRSRTDQNQNVPIVALTASTFLSKKRLALKAGMSDFLSKPFTPDQLFEILSKFLSQTKHEVVAEGHLPFSKQLDSVYLKEAYGDDRAYARDMFETFLEIVDEELLLLREVLKEGDPNLIGQKLHKIKPTFTMVGLSQISDQIESMERKLKSKEAIDPMNWYSELKSQIESYKPILRSELKMLSEWQND
ncbi:MAG: PAS domain S-box protein [Bacteroidota bacterium]